MGDLQIMGAKNSPPFACRKEKASDRGVYSDCATSRAFRSTTCERYSLGLTPNRFRKLREKCEASLKPQF